MEEKMTGNQPTSISVAGAPNDGFVFSSLEWILENAPVNMDYKLRTDKLSTGENWKGFYLSNDILELWYNTFRNGAPFFGRVHNVEMVFKIGKLRIIVQGIRRRTITGEHYVCRSLAGFDYRTPPPRDTLFFAKDQPYGTFGPGKTEWYACGTRLLNRAAEKYHLRDWIKVFEGKLKPEEVCQAHRPETLSGRLKSYLPRQIAGYLPPGKG